MGLVACGLVVEELVAVHGKVKDRPVSFSMHACLVGNCSRGGVNRVTGMGARR